MSLCKYRDALGRPDEGIHAPRIFGLALFDVAGTAMASVAIASYFEMSFAIVLFIMVLASMVAHRMFCVRTSVDRILFPTLSSSPEKTNVSHS